MKKTFSQPALTVTWFDFKEYILRFAQNYLTMKKTIPGCRLTTVLMATIFIIATSCVDERYDLTKIDETAVILKDITMPVGNIEPLTIEDFLTVDNFESSLIRPDDKGDFALEFEGSEPITVAVSVPAFDMAFEETGVEGRKVVMRMPLEIAGMDVSMLEKLKPEYYNKHISYEELTGSLVSLRKTVKLNDEFILSHYINDIKEIELNAELMYEFKLAVKDVDNSYVESPKAAMHVEKDFTIDFPDWLSIRKNDDIDAYIVENNANNKNVVRFVKDMYIPAENSIVFDLILNKAEVPAGFLVDGGIDELGRPCKRLEVDVTDENNMILIKGDIYLTPSDFDVVPKELELNMNLSFRNLAVKSALVSLSVSEKIDDLSYALPTVPEMFTRDGVVIDIYDPMMYFNINNQSPLDIKVSACLKTYRNDVELKHMYLSETGRNNPITIPHNFTGRLGISRLGGYGLIANPDIAMLFRTLPDLVKIDDINISVGEDYVRIYPGQSLECTVGYGFNAPLAFGPEFAIDLEYELKDLNLVLDYVGIESARLAFDAVNTIPLSLGVDALVVDADGNEVHDILINIEGSIQAGSLPSPSTSSVSITLNSTAKSINLDNLKLIFKASCPPAYQGVVINKRQGLEIRNLKIGLPEGVLLNLDELLDSEN